MALKVDQCLVKLGFKWSEIELSYIHDNVFTKFHDGFKTNIAPYVDNLCIQIIDQVKIVKLPYWSMHGNGSKNW